MTTITQDQSTEITAMLEDTVQYLCQDMFESGTPVSGETVWKVVAAYAEAKGAQFTGECL